MALIKEPTFEITKVTSERRPNGATFIEAKCVEDGTEIKLALESSKAHGKALIKTLLLKSYNSSQEVSVKRIQKGEIL